MMNIVLDIVIDLLTLETLTWGGVTFFGFKFLPLDRLAKTLVQLFFVR